MSTARTIYFDTNPLWESYWPNASGKLKSIAESARLLSSELVIPFPVELELENRWCRKFDEGVADLAKKQDSLTQLLKRANFEPIAFTPPTRNEALRTYRETAIATARDLGTRRCPFPTVGVRGLFERATQRVAPFADEGRGFQDAVILDSVQRDVEKKMRPAATFVSADPDFDDVDFETLRLVRLKTLDDLVQLLVNDLRVSEQRRIKAENDRAHDALVAATEQIVTFLQDTLAYDDIDFADIPGFETAEGIKSITKIHNVVTSQKGTKGKPNQRLISATVDAMVTVQVRQMPTTTVTVAEAPKKKLGARSPKKDADASIIRGLSKWVTFGGSYPVKTETIEKARSIQLEARATLRDKNYENLVFESAKISRSQDSVFLYTPRIRW